MVSSGASTLVPLLWSPSTARNSWLAGMTAPCARYGICGAVIWVISKPMCLPPRPGIPSGTSKEMLFIASMTAFKALTMAVIIAFTKPMMLLMAVLMLLVMTSQMLETVLLTACQAASQLPSNTLRMKSITPFSASRPMFSTSAMTPIVLVTMPLTAVHTVVMVGPKVVSSQFATGSSRLSHRAFSSSATKLIASPTTAIRFAASGARWSSHRACSWATIALKMGETTSSQRRSTKSITSWNHSTIMVNTGEM